MADEPAGRTSLGVLREILNNLGDSNQYHYLVDALEALKDLLGEGGIGEAVSDWLAAHPEATTTVQNGSITLLKLANDVKAAIDGKAASSDLQALADNLATLAQTVAEKADTSDLDDKADIDGYYSQLTAGLAENLIGRGDAVPAEYLYRTAGGTADIEDGIATIDCIKGNTLVWNQMYKHTKRPSTVTNGIDVVNNNDGSITLSGTATEEVTLRWDYNANFSITGGHKYLEKFCPANGSSSTYYAWDAWGSRFNYDTGTGLIFTANTNATLQPILKVMNGATINGTVYPQLFDLTLMFGEGKEPATVEEFEAMFPLAYYPYSAPKLLPVDIRGIETVGFNLWDEEWETGRFDTTTGANIASTKQIRSKNLIPVFPSTEYNVQTPNGIWLMFLDANKQVITSGIPNVGGGSGNCRCLGGEFTTHTFITPANCHYIKWYGQNAYGPTYNHDICINLSWSGYRNGEYEEHWSAERPIDTSRFFPTGMKKAGSKEDALYADHYDTVIGAVDLGTLTWVRVQVDIPDHYRFYADLPDIKIGNYLQVGMACAKYEVIAATYRHEGAGIQPHGSLARVIVYDEQLDTLTEAAFKAAMSGVILYYELATPTTTPIDPPLNLSYKVSDFGTERIMVNKTADAPQTAPVPMEVEYGINAIDTIRRLPKEYQSHKSMGQLIAALESSLGVNITETWDETEQRYEYEATLFEVADDAFACIAAPDGPTATTNHAVNTYLTMGGKLYKVTTAITAGDTIAAGTNVTQTTVMDELIALTT